MPSLSLFDPTATLPTDPSGHSPMQPVCARRLRIGNKHLIAGAGQNDLSVVTRAFDEIVPLLSCQHHNSGLPCGDACIRDVEKVLVEYQEIVMRPRLSA